MRIYEILEAEGKHVAFTFGRMNPPTVGHEALLNATENAGRDY